MVKAFDLINIDAKSCVYVANSTIKGKGLFAKKNIPKSTNCVIYYGDICTNNDVFNLYIENSDDYVEIMKTMRSCNDNVIYGKYNGNDNLAGVYVNDYASIDSDISPTIFKNYANTHKYCNLHVVDTEDYPVYVSTKRIKKNEELFIHYGIGYWLAHNGMTPDKISELNDTYNFSNYYK